MRTQEKGVFANVIATVVGAGTALQILIAFLIVIPLTLWLAWSRQVRIAESAVLTLFCLSFAWGNLSLLRWRRSMRNLGSCSSAKLSFGLGPRPTDPDELHLWQAGIQFRYSFFAIILSMAAFAITKWLNGD